MTTTRRRYESETRSQQAEQTKASVVGAAHELFVANGYATTGMREIATSAGVALETVYAHFSSKRGLLQAVIDAATTGDDAPIPVAERAEFLAFGRGTRAARCTAAAHFLRSVYERSIDVIQLLKQAAATDAELRAVWNSMRVAQRRDVAAAFTLIVGRAPTTAEADSLWAVVNPEVYALLVTECGWTHEQYENWIAATTARLLPRS